MEAPGGVEPPTNGLGNRCSIQLSYGAAVSSFSHTSFQIQAFHQNPVLPSRCCPENFEQRFARHNRIECPPGSILAWRMPPLAPTPMLTKAQAWQHSSSKQVVEVQSMAERVCKDWTGKFIPRAQIMQIQPAALVAKELGWASRIFTRSLCHCVLSKV
jgi:hypothetical protein